ncbi:hypothetical protein L3Q82_005376 [Scortum barcoo]|uniref:Uncharacterized protein n=1 Tax=Scortum barcoo TaxID=214431 RepID=A0ACB8VA14_9TELE|nr:hypothetical protein L3Q82_005376 [Scortum barcoo]
MRPQVVLCLLLQLIFELSSCTHLRVIPGSTLELPCYSYQIDFITASITWKFNALVGYTVKVYTGGSVNLPCHYPPSSQVRANALWFRDTVTGKRTRLNVGEDTTGDNPKVELLYPLDHDQTIIIRNVVIEDAGIYSCESAEGKKLSTVYAIVEVAPTSAPYSCNDSTSAWEPCLDENSRTGEPMLQESMVEFSMKLYSFFRQLNPSGNLLFSPISISGALSHLLLGARKDTRKVIERALCVPHDFHCVHFQMKKLREKLAGSLQMASQIYYNPQMNLSKSFTSQSIQFYDAEPARLQETSEGSVRMINRWVANKTNNKIRTLVESVSPSVQLMLLNAVSFSGQWKIKFEQKAKKGLFTKLDGDLVTVPLLYHQKYMVAMEYIVGLKAQVARFALTGDSSLYILLPRSNTVAELQQLEGKMTDTAVRQMIEQMKSASPDHVEVTLPQIKLDFQPDMYPAIKKLGLLSLFEDANLCGLYSEDKLLLDEARHRAFLALNEQGVEAGAVTSVSFSRSFPSFSALRPFILLLWSDQANVPLFIGRVTDP